MLEQFGDEILTIEEIQTETQLATIKTHYCWAKKLVISAGGATTVSTPLPVIVTYQDWQDNPLYDENRPIHISVTGPGQAQELVLIPTNGQAEFDFVSAVSGTFKIQATAEFPCDPAEIEVVVS